MEEPKRVYNESDFESGDFIQECLQAFDEGVAKIEEEYAVASKSA